MDKTRAQQVLARIDAILRWEEKSDQHKDQKFAELGKHLCEVRKQGYWRLGYKSFEAYLEEKFPDSRRKAYYLMSIHDHLPQIATPEVEDLDWSKALKLAKVARSEGRHFDCATWLHTTKQAMHKYFTGDDGWKVAHFYSRLEFGRRGHVEAVRYDPDFEPS